MNSGIAIIDKRAPSEAIKNLEKHCNVFLFESGGTTYEAISCHPDIFIFQGTSHVIVAPNAPNRLLLFFENNSIPFFIGNKHIGTSLKESTMYNCIETETHLFHKQGFTDTKIVELNTKSFISLPQAYTRCSMIALHSKAFITSDIGIQNCLQKHNFDVLYLNPAGIVLPPYKHGFIGGCMGLIDKKLFVCGSFNAHRDKTRLYDFLEKNEIELFELYDGNLYDVGGILFF